jgi:hypothetical protein
MKVFISLVIGNMVFSKKVVFMELGKMVYGKMEPLKVNGRVV